MRTLRGLIVASENLRNWAYALADVTISNFADISRLGFKCRQTKKNFKFLEKNCLEIIILVNNNLEVLELLRIDFLSKQNIDHLNGSLL